MKNRTTFYRSSVIFLMILASMANESVSAQPVTGLDNWFNRELHSGTSLPFHYLWSDTTWSGYSRWGEIFVSAGAKIITIGKPTPDVLKGVDIYILVDPDTTI